MVTGIKNDENKQARNKPFVYLFPIIAEIRVNKYKATNRIMPIIAEIRFVLFIRISPFNITK